MSLERVITEQQSEIDRMRVVLDQRFKETVRRIEQVDRLAQAAFRSMDKATMDQANRDALRTALYALDYCMKCEMMPCECEVQQGPTANLMADLRTALAQPEQEPQLKRIHPFDIPLEVFVENLSTRTCNVINAEIGYFTLSGDEDMKPPFTVRHLMMFSRKEIRKWPNLGKISLNEIEEALKNRGLQLFDKHDVRSLRLLREHSTYALRAQLEHSEQEPTCPECKAAVLYECVACSSNNYPPAAQRKPLTDDKYDELIFAVGRKHPGETRHETALRYIRQAEISDSGPAKAAHGIKDAAATAIRDFMKSGVGIIQGEHNE